jgi:large subunit ribosomal protein L6
MSRIGKMPISLPEKVEIEVGKGNVIKVKGPKGELYQQVDQDIEVAVEDGVIQINRPTDQKRHRAMHGLYRALIANMVEGVSDGFTKVMEVVGVGYRVSNTGNLVELTLGFSHPVLFLIPEEISVETKMEKGSNPTIILKGADKQLLGQVCAKIRALRKPEPYKGKGIRFQGEILRRKAGKAAAKK